MMKSPEPGFGLYRRNSRRPPLHSTSIGRVLIEGIVNPVGMVVVHVVAHQPSQMLFIQRDDVVENLTTATSYPTHCDSVLPRRLNTRALRLQAGCLQKRDHLSIEFRVAIQNNVTVQTTIAKCFPQLLHDPIGSRMAGDVEVQDSAASVFHNEEAIQKFEGQCRHGKQIHGDDGLSMVGQEDQPALAWITST